MKRRVFLALLLAALVVGLMPGAALAQGNSDETLMRNSAEHYAQAIIACNEGRYGAVGGLLQAAASNAKHIDPILADYLEQLIAWGKWDILGHMDDSLHRQIAPIYNSVMQDSYPEGMFDPGNPTGVAGGVGGQAGMS